MDLICTYAVKAALLHLYSDFLVANGIELRMFSNNVTPSRNSLLADFTESTFGGYAPIVPAPTFANQYRDPQSPRWIQLFAVAQADLTKKAASLTNLPQSVFGQFAVDTTTGLLFAAANFSGPPNLQSADNGVAFSTAGFDFFDGYMY